MRIESISHYIYITTFSFYRNQVILVMCVRTSHWSLFFILVVHRYISHAILYYVFTTTQYYESLYILFSFIFPKGYIYVHGKRYSERLNLNNNVQCTIILVSSGLIGTSRTYRKYIFKIIMYLMGRNTRISSA